MKRLFTLLAFFAFITLSSCKKDGIEHGGDYLKSYHVWHDFQKESGDSYEYQVKHSSWMGYNWETTITVKQGKVVERSYELKGNLSGSGGPYTIMDHWIEDETQLGTHEDGDPAITLEEIYKKAREEWLKKRDGGTTYFEAKNDGMISLCGYGMNGCQDDCFQGIYITFIRAL